MPASCHRDFRRKAALGLTPAGKGAAREIFRTRKNGHAFSAVARFFGHDIFRKNDADELCETLGTTLPVPEFANAWKFTLHGADGDGHDVRGSGGISRKGSECSMEENFTAQRRRHDSYSPAPAGKFSPVLLFSQCKTPSPRALQGSCLCWVNDDFWF